MTEHWFHPHYRQFTLRYIQGEYWKQKHFRSLFRAMHMKIRKLKKVRSYQSFPLTVILSAMTWAVVFVLLLHRLGGIEQRMQGGHAASPRRRRGMQLKVWPRKFASSKCSGWTFNTKTHWWCFRGCGKRRGRLASLDRHRYSPWTVDVV